MARLFPRILLFSFLVSTIGLFSFDVLASGSKLGLADPTPPNQTTQAQANKSDNPILNAANSTTEPPAPSETGHWGLDALSIFGRLLLAVGLSSILAFRPR